MLNEQGEAVAGARVRAWRKGSDLASSLHRPAPTVSGEDGSFELPLGTPGTRWGLRAEAETSMSESVSAIVPTSGKDLPKDIVLTLKPGGTVSGRVTTPNGEPLEGVLVRSGANNDVTDADGAYLLEPFREGKFTVSLGVPTLFSSRPSKRVEIKWGQAVEQINFELERFAAISGVVVDAEGAPLSGVNIRVKRVGSSNRRRNVRSGAGGHFLIANPGSDRVELTVGSDSTITTVEAGATDVRLVGEQQEKKSVDLDVRLSDGTPLASGAFSIYDAKARRWSSALGSGSIVEGVGVTTVRAKEGTEMLVHITAAQDLLGRPSDVELTATKVEFPPKGPIAITLHRGLVLRGTIVDEAGNPVPDLRVNAVWQSPEQPARNSNGRKPPSAQRNATSDHEGAFVLRGLSKGDYRMSLSLGRGSSWTQVEGPSDPLPAGSAKALRFVVRPTSSVSGTVVDPHGDPVAGVRLRARRVSNSRKRSNWVTSDAEGAFEITGLHPEHRVEVYCGSVDKDGVQFMSANKIKVDPPAQGVIVQLREGAALSGSVSWSGDHEAKSFRVRLEKPNGTNGWKRVRTANLKGDGTYRFAPIDPGIYRLIAELKNGRVRGLPVRVSAPDDEADLRIDLGVGIGGRLAGVSRQISGTFTQDGRALQIKTKGDGSFKLEVAPGARGDLFFHDPSRGTYVEIHDVQDGDKHLYLHLEEGALDYGTH